MKTYLMKILIILLAVAFTIYVVLSLFIAVFGERLAYPAPKSSYKLGEIPEQFFIDGKLSALYLDRQADYTILYSHGNGEDLGEIYPLLQKFANLGFNLLAYDYCGYGLTKGKPSEANVYKNVDMAFNYLIKEKRVPVNKIVVVGFSMGSSASNYIASKENGVAQLVLIGGFASALESIFKYNIFPFNFLKNIDKIGNVKCPVLFIHGTKDKIVRYFNAEKMYKACNSPKDFLGIKGAAHNNIFTYDEIAFWAKIKELKIKLDEKTNIHNL